MQLCVDLMSLALLKMFFSFQKKGFLHLVTLWKKRAFLTDLIHEAVVFFSRPTLIYKSHVE